MDFAGMNTFSEKYNNNFNSVVEDYKEAHKLTAKELKDPKDWRSMSDEEWKKTLESFDKYVETWQKEMDKKQERQKEAAEKAALKAPPGMRSIAASQAMLAVAASGFYAGDPSGLSSMSTPEEEGSEENIDHESNWTKRLKTDDQLTLRMAKEAQKTEDDAIRHLTEDISTVSYADGETPDTILKNKAQQ